MPSTSGAQHRAMEAAAHGNSTLGIPKKVGKEFAKADEKKPKKYDEKSTLSIAKALRGKPHDEKAEGEEGY